MLVRAERASALQAALRADKDACGVRLGFAAQGLEGPFAGREVGANEGLVFESASLIKVLILVEVFRRADFGEISLEQRTEVRSEDAVDYSEMVRGGTVRDGFTVEQLAEGMITVSDNTATNVLIDLVGMENVNSLARDLRMTRTKLGRKMMDFRSRSAGVHNLTSAADMVTLLGAIWGGVLLSPRSGRSALGMLERQRSATNIPAALPPGSRVAHKTGELGDIEHDAGIVVLPGRSFALAILTRGPAEAKSRTFRRVAAAVYEDFAGGHGT